MRTVPKAADASSGLTLAETLVSLTLLTLVMVSVLNLFPSSLSAVKHTRTSQLARMAAQNRIEALAAKPYSQLELGTVSDEQVPLSDGQKVQLHTTISEVRGHPVSRLKHLRCEAVWQGRTGPRKVVQEMHLASIRR